MKSARGARPTVLTAPGAQAEGQRFGVGPGVDRQGPLQDPHRATSYRELSAREIVVEGPYASRETGRSRKRLVHRRRGVLLLVGGAAAGFATLNGASPDVDPSQGSPTVERGTMVKSVVATGKIEPITKVEIKSKANGIIKALHVDVDSVVQARRRARRARPEQLDGARCAAPRPTCRPRARRSRAPRRSSRRTSSRPRGRTSSSRAARYDRAQTLFAQQLIAQSALDDAQSAVDVAENRKRAAQSQLAVSQAKVTEAARPGGAGQGRGRPRRRGSRQRHDPRADPRHGAQRATSRSAAPSRRSSTSARTPRS